MNLISLESKLQSTVEKSMRKVRTLLVLILVGTLALLPLQGRVQGQLFKPNCPCV
jgi:hypothetical protein